MAAMPRPRADVRVVDTAQFNAATLIYTQADVDIWLANAKDRVVFASNAVAMNAGLYVANVP